MEVPHSHYRRHSTIVCSTRATSLEFKTLLFSYPLNKFIKSTIILIIGGGIIGLMAAEFAKMAGAGYVALMETNKKLIEQLKGGN